MAKRFQFDRPVERIDRLTRSELEELLLDLLSAFQIIKEPDETALFVQDLLTKSEVKNLAKRLRIASLLLEGMTYREVEDSIHVSHGTVAKVASWLSEKGDGFRGVIEKLNKRRREESEFLDSLGISLRKRIQMYHDPQLLKEKIVRNVERKERERLKEVLNNLESKSNLYKRIDKYLKEMYSRK